MVDTEIAVWNVIAVISYITDVTFNICLFIVEPVVPGRVVVQQVHVLPQVVQGELKVAEEVVTHVTVAQEVWLVEVSFALTLWLGLLTMMTLLTVLKGR